MEWPRAISGFGGFEAHGSTRASSPRFAEGESELKHQRLSIGSFPVFGNESRSNISRGLAAILAFLLASAAGPAHAAGVFYVDKNDPNAVDSPSSGTLAKPYRTISGADHYRGGPGTTIIVKTGMYTGQVTINRSGTVDSAYVIQAANDSVTVDGTNDF